MTLVPRTKEEIYDSLRAGLTGKISGLTNFTTSSFNYVWTQAVSDEIRDAELDTTASYLEGFVDYAGGDVDESDLNDLGISGNVTAEELNERLDDANLNELVKIVGIDRDEGTTASGTVTFTTQSSATTIPAGTSVGTQPDADGEFFEYTTDEEVSNGTGDTEVDATVTAEDVGLDYNAGSGSVTYMPSTPNGVTSVTNDNSITGGEDEETNDELRERAKNAIFSSSGGGTLDGLIGYVEDNVEGTTVDVEEFFNGDSWHGNYSHAHVIVHGSDDDNRLIDVINDGRPVGVDHPLVKASDYDVAADVSVSGSDVSDSLVEDNVSSYLDSLGLGEDVIYNKLVQRALNADDDIDDVTSINLSIEDEREYFNEVITDDFEDPGSQLTNRDWSAWSGDTANFTIQNTTTISGSLTAELTSSNESVQINEQYTGSGSLTGAVEMDIQIDNQTGNASDSVQLQILDSGTPIVDVDFNGDGSISTSSVTWSAGTTHHLILQPFFEDDDVYFYIDGQQFGESFDTTASSFDEIRVINNTTGSAGTVNAYFDNVLYTQYRYGLGLGDISNNVTSVEGQMNGSSFTFVEGSDFEDNLSQFFSTSSDTMILWKLGKNTPSVTTGNTKTIEYNDDRQIYRIEPRMVDEGVDSIEDANGNTYVQGTDYEERDENNDERDDSIEWLSGGSSPADGVEFTVTYRAGEHFDVDYNIPDSNTTVENDEIVDSGTITVT